MTVLPMVLNVIRYINQSNSSKTVELTSTCHQTKKNQHKDKNHLKKKSTTKGRKKKKRVGGGGEEEEEEEEEEEKGGEEEGEEGEE